jgi:mannose-6-phosphate isomerase-like protein (cupin superfamily)
MNAGDTVFFPADVPHRFQATSAKVRVMVIYSPPYLEKPENVRR